jgi:hypothetical protein
MRVCEYGIFQLPLQGAGGRFPGRAAGKQHEQEGEKYDRASNPGKKAGHTGNLN